MPATQLTVLTPADPRFAAEISAFNTTVVHAPDLVVVATSAQDIAEALRHAREQDLEVHVQGAGHGAYAAITGGLLISTRHMDTLHIDPATRIATIGAGVRWGAVVKAAGEQGLFPITGSSPDVGVVGFLLGGGLGPLARSHGFGSDHVEGFTVVTGAGDVVQADAENNPDLFWALRGGSGKAGLGIVTEVRLRLAELRTFYAGALFFAEEHIAQAFRHWAAWTRTAHPEVSTSVAILRFPPLEVIPPPMRGRTLLALRFTYPGSAPEGERLAAPLRAAAPVYMDMLGELPCTEVARIHNDPSDPGPVWITGFLLERMEDGLAEAVLQQAGPGAQTPFLGVELRHLGEATMRDVPGGSAVGGRGAHFTISALGVVPDLFATVLPAAAERLRNALRPWTHHEANVNFMGKARSAAHFASAWPPATFTRLAEVRKRYDPEEVLSSGH